MLKFLAQNLLLLLLFAFSCNIIAQENKDIHEWRPIYDSIRKYYDLRDKENVSSYTEELFFSKKYQTHDSVKVLIGSISANLIEDENEALKYLNLSEKILIKSKDNKNLLAWNHFYKASWYYNNFYDKKALYHFTKADSVLTSINRKSLMSLMTKVGICHVLMKSGFNDDPLAIDQVLPHINEGLRVSDSLGIEMPKTIFLYKKGEISFMEDDLENAERFYRESLDLSVKINNNVRQALLFDRLAKVFLKKNQIDSAAVYQKKAVKKAEGINDLRVVSSVNIELGIFYNKVGKYNDAIKYLNYGKEILEKSGSKRKESYHDIDYNLAEAYFGKNEFKKGYTYLKFAKNSMQEAQQIKNAERVEEIEAKYQTEKKEQKITILKSQNELVQQQKTSQRYYFLGSIAVTSIAGLFFFFLYRNRKKTTEKLQELDKAKSVFFANISHEFRTPLTMISGPLQGHLQKEDLKEEDKSSFKMMHRNTSRLLSLVDQLLDISKIEAGSFKLKISKNNVIPFIGMLADGFTFMANEKDIEYKVTTEFSDIDTYFDADILEKIVVNLISNAFKYTPEKGSIICKAFISKKRLHFIVKNTGKGLTEIEIATIFGRFYQINENAQGVGIGLALVKELVALQKGLLTVESTVNEWTTFSIVIPIDKNSFTKQELIIADETFEVEKEIKNTKEDIEILDDINEAEKEESSILLVVDDNADIRSYIGSIFRNTYNILEAENGQEGINVSIEKVPDIIISDIMMPIQNGIELCNQLKNNELTSHIPIILLTAKAGEENEIEGIKTGADDYVTKPFNERLLKLRVENLIESRKKLQLRYSKELVLRPKDIAITSIDELFLERLQKVLDDKLTESSFKINDFSAAVGMSRMQLHRKLKALTGLSASEFIRSQRLKLAAQLLKKSEINVSQVGYSVGFNEPSYFAKCFKQEFGCSPSEYSNT